MNLLVLYIFLCRKRGGVVTVVYRRKNGGYGLLETDGVEE